MTCGVVDLGNGSRAIVCGAKRKCGCGHRETRLCDWKVEGRKSGTCDKPLCHRCTTSPKRGKDLCPAHAREFETWKEGRNGPAS